MNEETAQAPHNSDSKAEEILVLDLNKLDEDYDFLGNEKKHRKSRNPYKAGGHERSQKRG
jgi:hypothetical protein